MKHILATVIRGTLLAAMVTLPSPGVQAQAARSYRARLSTVPMDVAMAVTIAGSGSITAVVNSAKLTLNGTFAGLKSPATVARLHRGERGIRGPAILDLKVTGGTSGTITASIDLTPALIEDLQNSRLYVQLHSEKAPDGNLWGWLLTQETKR